MAYEGPVLPISHGGTGSSTGSAANLINLNATQLTSGTVPAGRLSSANLITALTYTPANVSGDTYLGTLTMGAGGVLFMNRTTQVNTRIQWYDNATYKAWVDYMGPPGATTNGITPSTGTLVTSWARRSFIENNATYGWIFESGTNTSTTPTRVFEIRASDGAFKSTGNGFAVQHASIGSAGAAGAVVVLDSNGQIPSAAIPGGAGGGSVTDFMQDTATTSGLNYGYKAGLLRFGGTIISVSANTIALTNNTINYVQVNSAGVVNKTTGSFTAGQIPMATVVTSGGAIGTVTDKRAFLEFDSGSSVQGTPTLIGTGDGSTTTFTLPYSKTNEILWKGGAIQLSGTDYTVNTSGQVVFTTAPAIGEEVMATAATTTGSPVGVTAMGTPTLIGTGNGVTTSFALPYTGANETVWKGGAIQLGSGVDYTVSSGNAVFTVAPASGVKIIATAAIINNVSNTSGSSSQGAPVQIGTGNGVLTNFTLPYSGVNEIVWRSGAIQVSVQDYVKNPGGTITFTTAPATGEEIVATASVFNTVSGAGGGSMSTPALIGTGDGTTTTFAVGGSYTHEHIWKGGLIMLPTTDYTKSGSNITFVTAPASGEEVIGSFELAPLVGTDAITLAGAVPSVTSAVSSIVKTDTSGKIDQSMMPDASVLAAYLAW